MTIRKHLLAAASQALDELSELGSRVERRFRTHTERATDVVRLRSVSVIETYRPPRAALPKAMQNVVPGGGIFGAETPLIDIASEMPDAVHVYIAGPTDDAMGVTKIELIHGRYVEVTFETGFVRGFPIFRVEEWTRQQ